jgi:hypothetical protein
MFGLALLAALAVVGDGPRALAQQVPAGLPHYAFDIQLDTAKHLVHVHERVTWTNRQPRPVQELVFNVFPNYKIPRRDLMVAGKLLEIYRLRPSEALDVNGQAIHIERVTLPGPPGREGVILKHGYADHLTTALIVTLPGALGQGQSVTVDLEFTLRLPQKQGRWGQWHGVTSLQHWYPVVAYHDARGWQPVPHVYWHPAPFQEAGVYSARLTLPGDQTVACTCSAAAVTDLGDGLKRLDYAPRLARDFALVASSRYREFVGQSAGVHIRCLAFPEHADHAQKMVHVAGEALTAYGQWFGPYPYQEFTIAESYPAVLEEASAGLILMEERLFTLPHGAAGLVEFMVARETCRQWWYNVVGVNGYCEAWLTEGLSTYFAHRLLDECRGKNNTLLRWPEGLRWLPEIERETYRHSNLYEALGRGEEGVTVQENSKFGDPFLLGSLVCDRGGKVAGMIENRLGPVAFQSLMRSVCTNHYFGMLSVAELRGELEAASGRLWGDFFQRWLYGTGTTDWAIERVVVERPPREEFGRPYKVTIVLHQRAEYTEPTELGICLTGEGAYPIRVPIQVGAEETHHNDPPATIEPLANQRVRVAVWLPQEPTQIAVDPDQVLFDRDPANNFWRPQVRWRLTPLYTALDETDLTCAYDRWNVIAGPWVTDTAYNDPWFSFSEVFGARLGVYRTQQYSGGVYMGYRPDFNDVAVGVDGLWDHWPWPKTQVGFIAEKSLFDVGDRDTGANRSIVFGRYIFEDTASFYQLPMHYLELFGTHSNNLLPVPRFDEPGAQRFENQSLAGVHYHVNMLTPYWDPETGFQFDGTYAAGFPILGQPRSSQKVSGQVSFVQTPPDELGWLSTTHVAARAYGGVGLPRNVELFTLGGSQLYRGFDLAQRQGNMVWIGSVEWRIPVASNMNCDLADHAVGLRTLYLAPFYDIGDVYLRGHQVGPIAHGVGVGLRLDLAWFSFLEHTILRLDVARTVNTDSSLQVWFGIEHPF